MTLNEINDAIEHHRLHPQVEAAIREDMLDVFDYDHPASEFHTEDWFMEHYLWNPAKWPSEVVVKVLDILDEHNAIIPS